MQTLNIRSAATLKTFLILFLAISLVLGGPIAAVMAASGAVGEWTTSDNTLPSSMNSGSSASYNGYAYVVGGSSSGNALDTIYYTELGSDGSVGEWATAANSLPQALSDAAVVAHDGFLYVAGGISSSFNPLDTVYYAAINNDGSISNWNTSPNTLPAATEYVHGVAYDGYMYVVGGYRDGGSVDTVYYAPIGVDEYGAVGGWSTSSSAIPEALLYKSVTVAENGYVYVLGGDGTSTVDTVHYAQLNANGSGETSAWATSPNSLPDVVEGAAATSTNGYLYMMGGERGVDYLDTVYYAKTNSDGTVGEWVTSPNSMPGPRTFGTATASGNFIYHFAGVDDNPVVTNSVFYAEVTPPPPGADYNNDGTPDSEQLHVSSLTSSVSGKIITLEVDNGCEVQNLAVATEANQDTQDAAYGYDNGLVNFTADCNQAGYTTSVKIYHYGVSGSDYIVRKHNPSTSAYTTIDDAVLTSQTINDQNVLVATYNVTDGGILDIDGQENGVIVDPVGLGTQVIKSPNTGLQPLR